MSEWWLIMLSKICSSWRTALTAVVLMLLVCRQSFAQNEDEAFLTEAARRGPAVATILDTPRETPAAQLQAILTLLDLGEDDVAAVLWKSLSQAELDDPTCAALAQQFGTAGLMKLARQEAKNGPETEGQDAKEAGQAPAFVSAKAFVERCLKAAEAAARDPKRISMLVANLNSDSPETRQAARVDLAATGTDGAKACLEALAQAEGEDQRANLMLGLIDLRPEVDPLLVTALADGRGHFRRDAAELTGYLRIANAVPWLAVYAAGFTDDPDVLSAATTALRKLNLSQAGDQEARSLLRQEIERLEAGVSLDDRPPAETYEWWTYDPEKKTFSTLEVTPETRRVLAIERLARTLGNLPRATEEDRRQALIYAFQVAQLLNVEPTAELKEFIDALSSEELAAALATAVQEDHVAAAIACAKLLGQQASTVPLASGDGRPTALAAALGHSSRQLRFAALEAIMKLSPQTTFAGASRVPKTLWEFAAGAGAPQAVAASSVAGSAGEWAGELRGLGYEAEPAGTGREALEIALNAPRLELILLDSDIGRPLLREVVYQLRSSPLTARIPVGVLSSLANLERARRIADDDPWLIAVPRPHDEGAMEEIVSRLGQLGAPQSPERRLEQAKLAVTWIGDLLEQGHPYDEMLRDTGVLNQTVYVPELVAPSLRALGLAGTAGSQQTLVSFASHSGQPIEARQQAAEAFAESVERFGKQLTLAEIRRQYDRYNTSGNADEQTQQVLGKILDVLEG